MNAGKDGATTGVQEREPTVLASRYEVLETLGGGGFGVVHKAWDRLLHRTVAIKVMRMEALIAAGLKRDEVLKRFEREATTAGRLAHPGIVTVYDIGISGAAPYLAMEYVDSCGLDKVIAREGALGPDRAALIALEMAEALEYAHGQGVLHRDVKPQNIVVPRSGARPVKLVDFGLAKALDCNDHLTRTGTFLGTPSYASPEQVNGEALDGRSDVWSIGCVLYEMLTGEKAFSGLSITDVVVKIMTVEPPAVRELDPGIPEDLARIVGKAMAKDVAARYASAGQLVTDLRRFVRSRTAAPALPAEPVAAAPSVPVRKRGVAVALSLVALVVLGIAMAVWMRRTRPAAPGIAPPATAASIPSAAPEPTPAARLTAPDAPAEPSVPPPAVSVKPPRAARPPAAAPARNRTLPVRPPLTPIVAPPPALSDTLGRPHAPSEVDEMPQAISLERPAWPRHAPPLRPGSKVSVTVSYVVGVDGSVSDVGIAASSGLRAVDEAVVATVRKARFRPGTKNGRPVATRMLHGFSFRGE